MYNILIFKVENIVINIDTANTGRLRLFLLQDIKKLMTSGEVIGAKTNSWSFDFIGRACFAGMNPHIGLS